MRYRRLAGLIGLTFGLAGDAGEFQAGFSSPARRLEIHVPASTTAQEIRVQTRGLSEPEVGTEVGEPGEIYLPAPAGADPARLLAEAQNIYFFNEFAAAAGWDLVIDFGAAAQGTWKLNGRFSPLGGAQSAQVVIPVEALESGENLLHLRGNLQTPAMYFRRTVPAGRASEVVVSTVPADWSGKVSLWAAGKPQPSEETAIAATTLSRRITEWPAEWWHDRPRVEGALQAVGRNLLNNQVKEPNGFFSGGFHLVYDPTRKAHRMAHWVWSWGPAIDLLLQLAKREPDATLAAELRRAALAAADRSLTFGEMRPDHPARGISTVRWEPSRATPLGWAEYLSPTDSLFLGGWGWMSAYAETRDPRYRDRLAALVGSADRLMDEYPTIPQDWIVERARWTPHTLDETLFGVIGFRRLFEATGAEAVRGVGRRFLERHLEHMGRAHGLLARAWLRDERKDIWDPDIKGHAWVMEGYLDGYRLTADPRYLALARELAAQVLGCQSPDGSWPFLFKRATPGDFVDDKGTAIWSYLLYDLYHLSRDPAHLASARRALGWCLRQQYRGDDPNLDGGIYHPCSMAYVKRRPMTVLYTTTFFGLALLEELKLSEPP